MIDIIKYPNGKPVPNQILSGTPQWGIIGGGNGTISLQLKDANGNNLSIARKIALRCSTSNVNPFTSVPNVTHMAVTVGTVVVPFNGSTKIIVVQSTGTGLITLDVAATSGQYYLWGLWYDPVTALKVIVSNQSGEFGDI